MRSVLVGLFLLLSFQGAHGQEIPGWLAEVLRQAEPDELAYFVGASPDCSITEEEIETIVKGVFVRSRIKPLGGYEYLSKDVYLNVALQCLPIDNNNPIYLIDVKFGKASGPAFILYERSFGSFGINTDKTIKQSIKSGAEAAITAYLQANFDLGD